MCFDVGFNDLPEKSAFMFPKYYILLKMIFGMIQKALIKVIIHKLRWSVEYSTYIRNSNLMTCIRIESII